MSTKKQQAVSEEIQKRVEGYRQKVRTGIEEYKHGQDEVAKLPIDKKVALMWRNHVVWRYLQIKGYSKVLGEDWQEKFGKPEQSIELARFAYTKIPFERRKTVDDLMRYWYEEHPFDVEVPKDVWEPMLIDKK